MSYIYNIGLSTIPSSFSTRETKNPVLSWKTQILNVHWALSGVYIAHKDVCVGMIKTDKLAGKKQPVTCISI